MTRMTSALVMSLTALALICQASLAADWGSVKGKFVYEGSVTPAALNITKDAEVCSKNPPVDEKVALGEKNALANVFFYLYLGRRDTVTIHPDYESQEIKPAVLDNKECRFEPHALAMWTKQPLEIKNSDPVAHNTMASGLRADSFNQMLMAGKPLVKEFTISQPYPSEVKCSIHPWMVGVLLIRDNPYFSVSSAKDGSFEIKNLPAGEHEFVIWHEAKGNVRDLEVAGQKTGRTGRVKLTIPAGETLDLGVISVSPALLGQ